MRPASEGRLTDCVGPRVGARVASYLSAALSRALPMGFARRRSDDDDDDDGDRIQDILPPSGHLPLRLSPSRTSAPNPKAAP